MDKPMLKQNKFRFLKHRKGHRLPILIHTPGKPSYYGEIHTRFSGREAYSDTEILLCRADGERGIIFRFIGRKMPQWSAPTYFAPLERNVNAGDVHLIVLLKERGWNMDQLRKTSTDPIRLAIDDPVVSWEGLIEVIKREHLLMAERVFASIVRHAAALRDMIRHEYSTMAGVDGYADFNERSELHPFSERQSKVA